MTCGLTFGHLLLILVVEIGSKNTFIGVGSLIEGDGQSKGRGAPWPSDKRMEINKVNAGKGTPRQLHFKH